MIIKRSLKMFLMISLLISLTAGSLDAKPRLQPYSCTTNSSIVVMADRETLIEIVALDEFYEDHKKEKNYSNLFFIVGFIVGVWI